MIYKWAKFNKRVQQSTEEADSFITALYALAENCEYGELHDELLIDRLVVGLRDFSLSERMQLNKDVTLTKAVIMARPGVTNLFESESYFMGPHSKFMPHALFLYGIETV